MWNCILTFIWHFSSLIRCWVGGEAQECYIKYPQWHTFLEWFLRLFCPQETICRNENTCKSRNSKEPERDNMDKLVPEPNCKQNLCPKSFFRGFRLWNLLMGWGGVRNVLWVGVLKWPLAGVWWTFWLAMHSALHTSAVKLPGRRRSAELALIKRNEKC